MKKIVFVGSVDSSDEALKTLIKENIQIDLVCSLNPEKAINVSDYCPIHQTAEKNNIPYLLFNNINDTEIVETIRKVEPDYIFVIGLSQIIKKELINIPKQFVVGFHPTALPHHRGRAAIPWQILLGEKESSITFFRIDQGMDSGDVLFCEKYSIEMSDYASDVYRKVVEAMVIALKENIHNLLEGRIFPKPQIEKDSSYLLIRRPHDGLLDWGRATEYILRIIRATSHPYPGAYSYIGEKKIIIYRAEKYELKQCYIGYNGQIAEITDEGNLIILTVDGSIKVTEYILEDAGRVSVGNRLIGAYDPGIHI